MFNPHPLTLKTNELPGTVHQLNAKKDKKLIKQYSDPAYVLNGWNPRTH